MIECRWWFAKYILLHFLGINWTMKRSLLASLLVGIIIWLLTYLCIFLVAWSIVKHAVYVVSNREILSLKCIPVIGCYLLILTPLTQFSSQLSLSWLVWRGTYLPHKWHFFIARRTLRVYFLWSKLQPNHQLSVWPIAFIPRPEQYAQWGKFASEAYFLCNIFLGFLKKFLTLAKALTKQEGTTVFRDAPKIHVFFKIITFDQVFFHEPLCF